MARWAAGHDMTAAQARVSKRSAAGRCRARRRRAVRLRPPDHPAEDETQLLREWKERRGAGDDPPLCREGTRGRGICRRRSRKAAKWCFPRSATTPLPAPAWTRAAGRWSIDTLVVAGLTTECCIDSSVRDAFERDYHVFVVSRRHRRLMSRTCTGGAEGSGAELRQLVADRRYRRGLEIVYIINSLACDCGSAWQGAVKCYKKFDSLTAYLPHAIPFLFPPRRSLLLAGAPALRRRRRSKPSSSPATRRI